MRHSQLSKSVPIILRNKHGMEVGLSEYGARITSIRVPDKAGNFVDVVLGFNTRTSYLEAHEQYHGATVGRFANRIAGGQFSLDEEVYHIKPNNGNNALHGGKGGFHARFWETGNVQDNQAEFFYLSSNGEEGFPGNLSVWVAYTLTDDQELRVTFRADTDKPTVINLTNHAYFNLNGEGSGTVLDHLLYIHAENYLPVRPDQIPTGEYRPVAGTPFDFREEKRIGQDIAFQDEQLLFGHGYDHCYVLQADTARPDIAAASAWSPLTGIRLDVFTTEPGIQLYTGNFLNGKDLGKAGKSYKKHEAFCLETQHFPDSPNQPDFPTTVLLPGEVFFSQTIYKFSASS